MAETRRIRLWAVAAAVVSATAYLLIRTDVHTYDALSYVLDVDRKPWQELFHPHHLAYGPLGALLRALAVAVGWTAGAEKILQTLNGLVGGVTIGVLTATLLRLTRRTAAALIAVALVAFSQAFWYYAGEIEVYTIAALGLVLVLRLLLLQAERPTPLLMLQLAAAQSFAVLFHQTNVLLTPVILAALWPTLHRLAAERRLTALLRLLLPYLLLCTLLIGGAYLWVAFGVSGLSSLTQLNDWLFSYARTGFWGGLPGPATLIALLTGWSRTFAAQGGWLILLLLCAAAPFAWRGLQRMPRSSRLVLLSWFLLYTLFFAWWEADNIEFWIGLLPVVAVLTVVMLDELTQAVAPARILPLAGATVALLALSNAFALQQRGDSRRDLQRSIAAELTGRTVVGDLLIVPDGVLELYLPHYGARDTVYSLSRAMADQSADWPAACTALQTRITDVQRAGFAVWIAADAVRPVPAPPGEPPTPAERFALAPETVAACYAPQLMMAEALSLQTAQTGYYRIAPAAEQAQADGWDFRRGSWGWRAERIEQGEVGTDGWQMLPLQDPVLLSPPLSLPTERIIAFDMTLATATGARDLQLFLLDAAGQASEARSLRAELQPGSQPQTVRLLLSDAADIPAQIGGLRLDPVSAGDGSPLRLIALRVITAP